MRVGLLWRAEWDSIPPGADIAAVARLRGVFAAFAAFGVEAEPVVYSDETAEELRARLLALDGVLVWVNPVEQGRDRSRLDPLLVEAAQAGVWVSAHPDVISKIATKQVLVDTREMGWGTETRVYRSTAELRDGLGPRLVADGPLVLKQHRGMGGHGVWKVELAAGASPGSEAEVRVQHAASEDGPELVPLEDFVTRCEQYVRGDGRLIEQPFQPRLAEGMIRAYLTHAEVVGFTRQYPRGLMPPGADDRPGGKRFEPPSEPRFADLRARLESEWVPQLCEIAGVDTGSLPVIWDADFLLGPRTPSGADTYVLCEINASSTFAFPELAMPGVARAALEAIGRSAR